MVGCLIGNRWQLTPEKNNKERENCLKLKYVHLVKMSILLAATSMNQEEALDLHDP